MRLQFLSRLRATRRTRQGFRPGVDRLEWRQLTAARILGLSGQFAPGKRVTVQVESSLPTAGPPVVTADFESGIQPDAPGRVRSWIDLQNARSGDGYTG